MHGSDPFPVPTGTLKDINARLLDHCGDVAEQIHCKTRRTAPTLYSSSVSAYGHIRVTSSGGTGGRVDQRVKFLQTDFLQLQAANLSKGQLIWRMIAVRRA
jgi:thiamine pyrophosphokinase